MEKIKEALTHSHGRVAGSHQSTLTTVRLLPILSCALS